MPKYCRIRDYSKKNNSNTKDKVTLGHSWGQNQLLQSSREETGDFNHFPAVATLWFINIIPLLLDLVYHNCILFDFTDVINDN